MVKVNRSYPPPPSLSLQRSYTEKDVIKRLVDDFHGKCYICNLKDVHDIHVEHLKSHQGGQNIFLKYDWDNLFLSCPHCNSIKNRGTYYDNIINCCVDDPEEFLEFYCVEDDIHVSSKGGDLEKAILTAELLTDVFNKRNTGIREHQCRIRCKELKKEMQLLYNTISLYKNTGARRYSRTLRGLLKRESAFAAFKRGYIKNNENLYGDLVQFLN